MSTINQLFTNYSLIDVVFILFLTAFVLKEILQLIDFFRNRAKNKYDQQHQEQNNEEKILDKMEELEDQFATLYHDCTSSLETIQKTQKEHEKTLNLLVASDKDDIKLNIVQQHHYFVKQGYIDDFSMDAIEKRYDHYKAEGGNSYITDLMQELRKLPKK